jgi:ATP phosphoribosyltransferase
MDRERSQKQLRIGLPKGHLQDSVFSLLDAARIPVRVGSRAYRPTIDYPGFDAKILKPQNIVEMLHLGSRDLGFAGADWVAELDLENELVELLDTGLDPVEVVAAAPTSILHNGQLPARQLIIASEYERLTRAWIDAAGLDAVFVRSFGATEVFPPEDADCVVDNTATGSTLRVNSLSVVETLMTSSTRLYANPAVLAEPDGAEQVERFVLLLRSVLEARRRVMVEVNVAPDSMESVIAVLPCMREPTVAPLHGDEGFAVKAAVPIEQLPAVIPEIKARGGTDIVVTPISQIVP